MIQIQEFDIHRKKLEIKSINYAELFQFGANNCIEIKIYSYSNTN